MSDKPITIVISDLHVGAADKADDHIYKGEELVRFLRNAIPEASEGKVELFINGDFLEFAQVKPEAFDATSPDFWCSQDESTEKLNAIIAGHDDIFKALGSFQGKGNQVTLAAGNHDVDLYWPGVQERLRQAIHPGIKFELGADAYFRYGTRLVIGHGHKYDPANKFKNWKNPIDKDHQRLEMCPGTLFMVKFVNWLEEKYTFSDNVKPITALGRLLWNEQRKDFKAAAKILFQFIYDSPLTALAIEPADKSTEGLKGVARVLRLELTNNSNFQQEMTGFYRQVLNPQASTQTMMDDLNSDARITEFLKLLLVKLEPQDWLPVMGQYEAAMLGEDDPTTLAVLRAGMSRDKQNLRDEAITYLTMESGSYEVVVFGHTHQPDEWRGSSGKWDGGYFNPGSWTRYVDLDLVKNLTMKDLQNEDDFPYQLNFIRIEQTQSGSLKADKICFEEGAGARFKPTPKPTKYL
jgi:UDP-2,3-diacylglucosamine pyrophosphatase LpxH